MKIPVIVAISISVIVILVVVIGSESNYQIEKDVLDEGVLEQENMSTNVSVIPPEYQALIEALEAEQEFDFESHDLVRFYEGEDRKGATIVDILNARMYQNYPDLNSIVLSPHRVEWYNFIDGEKGENFVIVGYAFETFKEKSEYIWEVNKIENTFTAKNEAAQELLDIVNSED